MEKHEYERINNLLRTLMNRNSTTYSEISKNSENITSGSCTLTIDTIRKCFIFKINGISHPICLYPSEKKISNIKYINEMNVDDLLTISNFLKHPQLIEFFKGFASKIHSHEISDINNLQNQLDLKALRTDLDNYSLKTDLNNYYTKIFIDDTFVLKTTFDILNTKITTDINNITNKISKINDLLKYLAINNEDIENEFYEINIPIKVNEINDMKVIDLLTPDKIKNNQELQNLLRGQQGIQGIPGIQGEKGERGP